MYNNYDDTECIICGEPSNGYLLCKDCYHKYEGQIINLRLTVDPEMYFELTDETNCIVCGEPSDGKPLCLNCFNKYKTKDVLLKIRKCKFPCGEPLDERYENLYDCADGHVVKSKDERHIDNFLFENNILHGYETPLDVGVDQPLKPDFYLKDYLGRNQDVYIEYFGITNDPKYEEMTKYKIDLYKKAKVTLICLYAADTKNLDFALKFKLNKERIKPNEINYKQ